MEQLCKDLSSFYKLDEGSSGVLLTSIQIELLSSLSRKLEIDQPFEGMEFWMFVSQHYDAAHLDILMQAFSKISVAYSGAYVFTTMGGMLGRSSKPLNAEGKLIYVPGGRMFQVVSADGDRYRGCVSVNRPVTEILPVRRRA